MEDANMLAADCIVISCCCQCLILQILIFILLKVPRKLFKKTKELYAKKFRAQKKKATSIELARYTEDSFRSLGNSFKIEAEDFCLVESLGFQCCMDEIEEVFDDFSSRGEFGFGSFWGGCSRSFSCCLKEEQVDYGDVGCHLQELFGATNFPCH